MDGWTDNTKERYMTIDREIWPVQLSTFALLDTSKHVHATGSKCARQSQVSKMPKHNALKAH